MGKKQIKETLPLIVANWKMNGELVQSMKFMRALHRHLQSSLISLQLVVCPPALFLRDFAEKTPGTGVKLGGQDCHHQESGAFTGEISANMLKSMMCDYVIVGHSERRMYRNEGSEAVNKKAVAAINAGLTPIICIGETAYERENNLAQVVVREQLLHSVPADAYPSQVVIAYEPVWAIGSGTVPTPDEISSMHAFIKQTLLDEHPMMEEAPSVIYGGSISPTNANLISSTKDVDGLLVGKASLDIDSFWSIVSSIA